VSRGAVPARSAGEGVSTFSSSALIGCPRGRSHRPPAHLAIFEDRNPSRSLARHTCLGRVDLTATLADIGHGGATPAGPGVHWKVGLGF
jgi:hypothetical protein